MARWGVNVREGRMEGCGGSGQQLKIGNVQRPTIEDGVDVQRKSAEK